MTEPTGTVSSRRIHAGRVVTLNVDQVRFPDGRIGEQEIVRHTGASVIVPFLTDPHDGDASARIPTAAGIVANMHVDVNTFIVGGGYAGLSVRLSGDLAEPKPITTEGPIEFVANRFRGRALGLDYSAKAGARLFVLGALLFGCAFGVCLS